jgi:Uma2 family endonuclease
MTLAEWDALDADPARRFELVEGVLLVVPKPSPYHQFAMVELAHGLNGQLPADLCAVADVEILVEAGDPATVRAPDVVVVPTDVFERNPARIDAADVLLAVEILSPGTRGTDRVTKFAEYADAGIGAYWLVDLEPPATLTAYALVDGEYETTAEGTGELELLTPRPLRVDVGRLTTRR